MVVLSLWWKYYERLYLQLERTSVSFVKHTPFLHSYTHTHSEKNMMRTTRAVHQNALIGGLQEFVP